MPAILLGFTCEKDGSKFEAYATSRKRAEEISGAKCKANGKVKYKPKTT